MSALMEAVEALAARQVTTVTITQYVDLLGGPGRGGGTRAAAMQLGVSQREIQRYLAYERGDEKQRRKPPAVRVRTAHGELFQHARRMVIRRMERDGATVEHIAYYDNYDERDRDVSREEELSAATMRALFAEEEGAQDTATGKAFIDVYFGGDQDVSNVHDIVLDFAE